MIRMYFTRFFGALTLALVVLVTYTLGAVLLGPGHGPGLPQGIVMAVMIVLFVLHGWTWLRSEGRGIVEAYPQGYQFDGLTKAADKARASVATCLQAAGEGMDVSIAYEFEHPRKGATWTWGTLESWTDDGLTLRDIGTSQNDGGPRYEVGRDTLLDWQYREADGRMRGSFLAVALMHHRESKGGWLSPLMRRERDLLAEYKLWEA